MLINGCVVQKMSALLNSIFRDMIDNSNWRVYVAELMFNWKDPMLEDDTVIMLPPV